MLHCSLLAALLCSELLDELGPLLGRLFLALGTCAGGGCPGHVDHELAVKEHSPVPFSFLLQLLHLLLVYLHDRLPHIRLL